VPNGENCGGVKHLCSIDVPPHPEGSRLL
jgi:hypothetical protein